MNQEDLPIISSYGNYSSDNYGAHTLRVTIPNVIILWFSYETVVAFNVGDGLVVSENAWGSTTGKHLNWIDGGDKRGRLPRSQFEQRLSEVLTNHRAEPIGEETV